MISASTKLLCIFGNPVKHSKSPLMHNAVLAKLGLDYVYTAFDVEPSKLGEAVAGIRAMGIRGANITIPHKEEVVKYLDYITEEAEHIGSVNTVFIDADGKLAGDNTDGRGFVISLMKDGGFDPKGKTALVIGAGGASRAVCAKLVTEHVKELCIFDISREKAENLKENLEKIGTSVDIKILNGPEELNNTAKKSELIVNCTPVGMKDSDPLLLGEEAFEKKPFVFDLIYNPYETKLLKQAKEKGCSTMNGLGMLVYQGALSFERWTGEKPDTDLMFKIIKGE